MRGYASTLFFFTLTIILAVFILFFLGEFGGRFMVKSALQLNNMIEEKTTPLFRLSDVKYEDYGDIAYLKFDLINQGDPITVGEGWFLSFYKRDGSLICRTQFDPMGAGSATLSALDTVYIETKNKTLSWGDAIDSGDIAYIEARLSEYCRNETQKYARQGEKMMVKLEIPPSGYTVILQCEVDPYTGFATCSET